jgi:peroxiredoxin Q/BCP
MSMPEVGQEAPDFTGATQGDETLRLSDLRGQKVALYFYPKDNTSGCTKQACNLRDNWEALKEAGIAVVGVSGDSVKSHDTFAAKYELPFPLVADPDHTILEQYGVWQEKNMYGRTYWGTKRTTFLIDEKGNLAHVIKRPKTGEHTVEILKGFGLAG